MAFDPSLPVIALVGRTNVGKSTLFNRLTHSRRALVHATPGLTRDRREAEARHEGHRFTLVDTGGLAFHSPAAFSGEIQEQVERGVERADAVWLVVSATDGLTPLDEELYRWLLRRGKPVLVAVNKVDNRQRQQQVPEFHALGAGALYPITALHNRGLLDLLEATAERVPGLRSAPGAEPGGETPPIRIAFMGRPNVGKSSLVNRVLDESRMIVSEAAGTTREPVDLPFRRGSQEFVLIDTVGLRRRAKTREALDRLGAATTLGALSRTDVAVIVLDATQPVSEQDAKIAGLVARERRAVVIAMNKWDQVQGDRARTREFTGQVGQRLRFLDYAPRVHTSALTGDGMERLFRRVRAVFDQFDRSIQTADLNRVIPAMTVQHPPPARGRSPTKVFYGSQVARRPPVFRLFTNHPDRITPAYTRYVANQLRYHFGLQGTPVELEWKGRSEQTPGGSGPPRRRRRRPA